jgi:hypothetical protein
LVGALSIIGQIERIFSAKADLTYVNESFSRSLRFGIIFMMIDCASKILENSASLPTAAVLTSDSASLRKAAYRGRRTSLAYSNPMPFARSMILSATR